MLDLPDLRGRWYSDDSDASDPTDRPGCVWLWVREDDRPGDIREARKRLRAAVQRHQRQLRTEIAELRRNAERLERLAPSQTARQRGIRALVKHASPGADVTDRVRMDYPLLRTADYVDGGSRDRRLVGRFDSESLEVMPIDIRDAPTRRSLREVAEWRLDEAVEHHRTEAQTRATELLDHASRLETLVWERGSAGSG